MWELLLSSSNYLFFLLFTSLFSLPDMLLLQPVDAGATSLPTPNQLKKKIIIKVGVHCWNNITSWCSVSNCSMMHGRIKGAASYSILYMARFSVPYQR